MCKFAMLAFSGVWRRPTVRAAAAWAILALFVLLARCSDAFAVRGMVPAARLASGLVRGSGRAMPRSRGAASAAKGRRDLLRAGMGNVEEFGEDEGASAVPAAKSQGEGGPTDEELGKTNGYEGDFKVGNVVRVNKAIKIWAVKPYTKDGFDANGLVGTVSSLVLYGRKKKSLCSAITPVKVEFDPTDASIEAKGLKFERKFTLHFCAEELEHVK